MSSTHRGAARNANDYYRTPVAPISAFLQAVCADYPDFLAGPILDPCAGGDAEHPASYPEALSKLVDPTTIASLDIRPDSRAGTKADYLAWAPPSRPHLIITNPPYAIAQEFITKALEDVAEGGYVAMLLRLNFLGSLRRIPLWVAHPPIAIYVHPRRMSFTEDGKTDSIEYMHAVWKRGSKAPPIVRWVLP